MENSRVRFRALNGQNFHINFNRRKFLTENAAGNSYLSILFNNKLTFVNHRVYICSKAF